MEVLASTPGHLATKSLLVRSAACVMHNSHHLGLIGKKR